MKNSSDSFEPIYLQDAKRHVEWLLDKIKHADKKKDVGDRKVKKASLFAKFVSFLKRVF